MDCLRLPTDLTGWVYKVATLNNSFQKDAWWMKITTKTTKTPNVVLAFGEGLCAGHTSTTAGSGGTHLTGAEAYTNETTVKDAYARL